MTIQISKLEGLKREYRKKGFDKYIVTAADEAALLAGYFYDPKAGDHIVKFLESFVILPKEEKPFLLLDYQKDEILRPLFGWKRPDGYRRFTSGYIEMPKKNGKALDINTPIPTPNGFKRLRYVQPGDQVFAGDGTVTTVTATSEIFYNNDCYKITFGDGSVITADADHLWYVRSHNWQTRKDNKRENTPKTVTTSFLYNYFSTVKHPLVSVPVNGSLKIKCADLPCDPYTLGYWLGDGEAAGNRISMHVDDVASFVEYLNSIGYAYEVRTGKSCYTVAVHGVKKREQSFQGELRKLGVLKNKHIPEVYLFSSEENRLWLLRGLLDSDGYCSKNAQIEYTSMNKRLAYNVLSLCKSLGIKTTISKKDIYTGTVYRVQAYTEKEVFHLKRKKTSLRRKLHTGRKDWLSIVSIEKCLTVPTKCIAVDHPDKLYLAGETFIVTHNTTIAAGIGAYCLVADGEKGAEVYCCANDREQADLVWNTAAGMFEKSPYLTPLVKSVPSRHRLIKDSQSWFMSWSSDRSSKDGPNIFVAICDELHEWDGSGREFWDKILYGGAVRDQPLCPLTITTAGSDRFSLCYEQHTRAKKILTGAITNEFSFFPRIWGIDPEELSKDPDYWKKETAWKAANPSYGHFLKKQAFEDAVREAENDPAKKSAFLRYRLGYWTEADSPWIDMDVWRQNAGPDNVPEEWYAGRECFVGVDLASKEDTTSIVYLFPYKNEETGKYHYRVKVKIFCPEFQIKERARKLGVRYDLWVQQKYMYATDGDVIDHEIVFKHIQQDSEVYDIKELRYDRKGAEFIIATMQRELPAIELIPFGQGMLSMSDPTKGLYRALKLKRIEHFNHPVLTWMASNCVAEVNAHEDEKLTKKKSKDKIDGMVALVMAFAGASIYEHEPKSMSVYGAENLQERLKELEVTQEGQND